MTNRFDIGDRAIVNSDGWTDTHRFLSGTIVRISKVYDHIEVSPNEGRGNYLVENEKWVGRI